MTRELLSSRLTYRLLKFGMPTAYLLVGLLVVAVVLAQRFGANVIIEGDSPTIRVLLVVMAPLVTIAILGWVWDLKYVELEGNRLLVSGVRRRIVVPLADVAAIRQNLVEPGRPIYIDLKTPGEFGATFSFVPAPSYAWDSQPLAERLRDMAGIHKEP